MQDFFGTHKKTRWALIAVLAALGSVIVFLALFDWNLLRAPLARRITAATGRPARIEGDLKVHLFSFNPSADVYGLVLENPSWADRRIMFGAKRITVSVSLGRLLLGQIVMPNVDLLEPVINLERDAEGRASWELGTKAGKPNHDTRPAKVPVIRRLIIEGGKLHVNDQIRKLTFSGSLVAGEQAEKKESAAFEIRCAGTLNAKPFRLEANGGPLLNLEPSKPYSFAAHLTASDINLDTHVTVRKPFDLGGLDIGFVVAGNDLADVYYLTGLALPNTPKYRLAATVVVNGTKFTADDLKGSVGTSDLEGKLAVDATGTKPKLTAKLASATLDIADLAPTLGKRTPNPAALSTGRASKASTDKTPTADQGAAPDQRAAPDQGSAAVAGGRLLPDADLQVNRVRGMDADVTYVAGAVKAPKVPLKKVDIHLVLHDGLLTIEPLSFELDQGKFTGKVRIDARPSVPVTDVDMRIDDIHLDQFKSAAMKEPPLDGALMGRFKFHGTGASVHKFASSSDGAVSVVIPHGQINEAIAELTGINVLQGLGLLIAKDEKKAEIRCGILDFKDQGGSLNTTVLYVDTSNVLITGRGKIDLGDEDIDLSLKGDPKHLRLVRLRAPISLGGTLLHPTVGIKGGKLAEQAGVAAALGALLTPAAAALAFIDPGLAKNKDCSTVLDQAQAGVRP